MKNDQTIELLQTALDSAANGIIITDNLKKDNPIIYSNPGFEQISGYEMDEIIGRNCRFLQGSETDPEAVKSLRRAIQSGEFIQVEIRNYRKDGTPFWNELSISPVTDSSGKVTNFIGIQNDVTDRIEKERAMKAQLMAENIVDTVREPLVILNDDLTVRSVNQSFYRFFETTPDAIIGRSIYEIEDGHLSIPALKTLIENILPHKNPFDDFEVTHDFPRIGVKHLLINARRLERNEERPEFILLAIEDVTRWKENKTALYESERQTNLVIEALRDVAILTTDVRGLITSWNPGAERIVGYTGEEILGQPLSLLFTLEEEHAAAEEISLASGPDGRAPDNRWMRRKDGSLYWAEGMLTALRDESNALQGFAKIINDQTSRKLLEEEMIARAEELAARDRAKDEFLAMLGHELRNPLGAVSNAVQVIKTIEGKMPILERPLAVAGRQIAQMSRLVNDLLDVARVTQGKITLKNQLISLDQMIAAIVRQLEPQATKKNLRLKYYGAVDVKIIGDPDRLDQIITNLITNAIKYTDQGEVRVELTEEQETARVVVRDTGIGIDPELLPRIFDLFSQATQSLARSQGGLGIGLTVVKQLVELHGGSITVESAGAGAGSSFAVTFPLAQTTASDEHLPAIEKLKVLIVDDNEDSAEMAAQMIEMWGYQAEVAHNGAEGLEKAGSYAPDVLLLDIGLPRLNGYQVAENLRRNPGAKRITIIGTSGYGQDADKEQARTAGFDQYLTKPIDFEKLENFLEQVNEGRIKQII